MDPPGVEGGEAGEPLARLGPWSENVPTRSVQGDRLAWSPPSFRTDQPSSPRRRSAVYIQGSGEYTTL